MLIFNIVFYFLLKKHKFTNTYNPIMKTTNLLTLLFIAFLNLSNYAQNIGINGTGANAHPSALLDIDAVATPSLGILIPRIALQATNLSAPVSGPATSLLVYNMASASSGSTAVTPGYYYWDGTKWVAFSGSGSNSWALLGNAGTTAGTNFLGTMDNQDLVFKTNNTERWRITQLSNELKSNGSSILVTSTSAGDNAIGFNNTSLSGNVLGNNNSFGGISNTILGNNNTTAGGGPLNCQLLGNNFTSGGGGPLNSVFIGNNINLGGSGPSKVILLGGTGVNALNVGVGMTNPSYPMDVIGASPVFTGRFTNVNTNGTGVFASGQGGGGYYLPSGSGGAFSGSMGGIVCDASAATGTGIRGIGNGLTAYAALVAGSGGAFAGTSIGLYGIGNTVGNSIAGGYFSNGNNSYAYVGFTTAGGVAQKINGPGAVSTIVKNTKNELVNLYCPEAPEVLFQDFGKGTLNNGVAHIELDETFTKNVTINDKHPLRVIIQLEGDCKGVFVANKTANGFDVKELQGGTSSVAFTYFVTANRADAYNEDGSLFSKFADVRYGEAPAKQATKNEAAATVEKR